MYTCKKTVRFAHCDPAGIVFYPRYAELCNEVVEDWFERALGIGFRRLHEVEKLGIPTVRLEIDYLAPSTYGETMLFTLGVAAVGNTSLTLRLVATVAGQERVRFVLKVVMVDAQSLRPVAISPAWRERFKPFLMEAA